MKELLKILSRFDVISLDQMNLVSLLNRFDSKYNLSVNKLVEILGSVAGDYYVLKIKNELIQDYKTTYYDTKNNTFYLEHHNGKMHRMKIRKREYLNSGISFLEIKRKNNKGKTNKTRLQVDNMQKHFNLNEMAFLLQNTNFDFRISNADLPAKIENTFKRITLVNKELTERCTIDLSISFHSGSREIAIEDFAIVELKQGSLNMKTPLSVELHKNHIHRHSFSKYCIGRAMMEPELKQNLFKAKLLRMFKQYNGNIIYSNFNNQL